MKYKGRLQAEEREQISLMLSNNSTMMQIGAALNRSASTIGREVYRNHSARWIPSRFGPFTGQETGAGFTPAPEYDFKQ